MEGKEDRQEGRREDNMTQGRKEGRGEDATTVMQKAVKVKVKT